MGLVGQTQVAAPGLGHRPPQEVVDEERDVLAPLAERRRVAPSGRAIGVDMTAQMRKRAASAARAAGLSGIVEIRAGDAESLPVESGSADAVLSNGVLNLTTDKHRAFSEIARVLRPGGRLLLADIVVESELSEGIRSDIDLWTG